MKRFKRSFKRRTSRHGVAYHKPLKRRSKRLKKYSSSRGGVRL